MKSLRINILSKSLIFIQKWCGPQICLTRRHETINCPSDQSCQFASAQDCFTEDCGKRGVCKAISNSRGGRSFEPDCEPGDTEPKDNCAQMTFVFDKMLSDR